MMPGANRPGQSPERKRARSRKSRWLKAGVTPARRCPVCGDPCLNDVGVTIHEAQMHREQTC